MEIKTKILVLAFFITLFIFISFLLFGVILDNERFGELDTRFDEMQNHITDIQQLMLMSEIYGDDMACVSFETKIKELDVTIWDLGIKLDQYKTASEEFQKDPYYARQNKLFNQQEVLYLLLLQQIYTKCDFELDTDKTLIISYFYSDSKTCDKCDDQSFVLTDINQEIDQYISIFSFDTELNITGIDALMSFYDVDELPCVLIEDEKFCGIRGKKFLIQEMCKKKELPICEDYTD